MGTVDKYDWIDEPASNPSRAVHKRLQREVALHGVCITSLSDSRREQLTHLGTLLADLDHPCIPYLVDFIERDDHYLYVVESFSTPFAFYEDTFERVCQLEQLCGALAYAHQRGVAHGDLQATEIRQDAQGQLKLSGLGMRQVGKTFQDSDHAVGLFASDLQVCANWLQACCQQLDASGPRNEIATDPAGPRLGELAKIVGEVESCGISTFEDFHRELRNWVELEARRRESDKLRIESPEVDANDSSHNQRRIVVGAVVGAFVLLCGILVFASNRPRPDTTVQSGRSNSTTQVTAASPSAAKPSTVISPGANSATPGKIATTFASDLGQVGILNKQANEVAPDAVSSQDRSAVLDTSRLERELKSEVGSEAEQVPISEPSLGEAKPTEDLQQSVEQSPPQTPLDEPRPLVAPFQDVPQAVNLPALENREPVELFKTPLRPADDLKLKLHGGEGAFRTGQFALKLAKRGEWAVHFLEKETDDLIASLVYQEGGLQFQWLLEEKFAKIGEHVSNCVLVLHHGSEKHAVALRTPEHFPSLEVDLEQRRPLEIVVPQFPDPKDVYVEFLPNGDSTVTASKSIIRANEAMQLGLDDGKQSLIVLEVLPKFSRRKQSLRFRASTRPSPQHQRTPIKPGTGKKLQMELMSLSQSIFQFKALEQQAKGDAEDRIEARIELLERKKQQLDRTLTIYGQAASQRLGFHIFRQIGGHRVSLARFEGVPNEPAESP